MENKEVKRTRPEVHNCNECKLCQESILKNKPNHCATCWFLFFEKLYHNFSSGNKVVDEIIKNPIYLPPIKYYNEYARLNYYSWIPWDRLSNINKIAKGGFGIIYKATLIDGLIDVATIKHHGEMEYKRWEHSKGMQVAIKIIKTSSSEVFKELNIQRAMFINKNGKDLDYISSIFGITQNAETLEYGIVMEFAEHGDMRKYLSTNFHSTSWSDKLGIAHSIAQGLFSIHSSGMVHRDLHSGNILQYESSFANTQIGDLGLCQPVNNEVTTVASEKKIYGSIPYIPPEVLRGEKFTSAGDIYSFAMLLWELATGKPPFHDCEHDQILIMAILNGARPTITSPLIPPSIAKIMKKCWDVNPKNRPTAYKVADKLWSLMEMYRRFKNEKSKDEILQFVESAKCGAEMLILQFLESDKCVMTTKPLGRFSKYIQYLKKTKKHDEITKSSTTPTRIHPGAVYTSRLLTAQMVNFSEELVYLPEDNS
ncbi:hypothetical protein G9A89_002328 [Geosiphon pyriformis]|nr:hypothetical protein G9A89_002328 [Geosiphon pyriformis]